MKVIRTLAVLALLSGPAMADGASRPFTEKQLAQQQRMRDCAAESKRLGQKGEVRVTFMSACLKAGQITVEVGDETASVPAEPRKPPTQK